MDNLFTDPGRKLKKWAKYLFVLNCIGFAVMAIVLANQEYNWRRFVFILRMSGIVRLR